MRRVLFSMTVLATMGMLFTAAPALAQNPHYTVQPFISSTTANSITACSTIAGLGNTVTPVTLTCTNVEFTCTNRGNNTDNAHQTLTTTQQFQPHNGTIKNACVSVSASCPDHQTATITNFGTCTYTADGLAPVTLTP